jgi:hypothetical protein
VAVVVEIGQNVIKQKRLEIISVFSFSSWDVVNPLNMALWSFMASDFLTLPSRNELGTKHQSGHPGCCSLDKAKCHLTEKA